jgi:hypothetical protein
MGAFTDRIRRFTASVATDLPVLFVAIATHAHRSAQEGSPVTGARGQPVQSGNLRLSIQLEFPTPTSARISTNVIYARDIEDGVRLARSGQVTGSTSQRLVLRSPVGGFHSFRLTRMHLPEIVAFETARLKGAT